MPDTVYQARLDALLQLEFFGMKLGLQNIYDLLEALGRPERKYPAIHIAGTNGKGSVAAMLSAVHQAAGKKTGLYTSPHLVDFRERIKINGEMISQEAVTAFLEKIWPKVEELNATFFEVTTAMAFDHFANEGVDIAIIETGLGGRLDATNVLDRPLATVITSIGYDHMAQLGNTIEEIASEKAGIFKTGSPAVFHCDESIDHIFLDKAKAVQAPALNVREWSVPDGYSDLLPSLNGAHQKDNLKTVLAALSVLSSAPSAYAVREGISHTEQLTGLRARLQEVEWQEATLRGARLFLDVGHNEQALTRVREYFNKGNIRPIVVMGLMHDKAVDKVLEIVSTFAKSFVAVAAPTKRAMPASELAKAATHAGMQARASISIEGGIQEALSQSAPGDIILLTGSHYVIGEFLKNFHSMEGVLGS